MDLKQLMQKAVYDAAKKVYQEMGADEIEQKLKDIPRQIAQQKQVVKIKRDEFADIQDDKNKEEALLASMIASELNQLNKPKYSNAEARNAELFIRKQNSPEYIQAEAKFKKAEKELSDAVYKLEQLQDEFKSLRMVARIVCKKLALFGLKDDEEDDDRELY